uniref:NADH-ubiquinone oxidoreductase chain 6 n=1 Tax=Leptocorisa costalis TaxID=2899124 RepID=A0A8T9EH37_9HEMI|nr:NADH dehydrogenase subunit 6 [Leptocorisa costalis]UNA68834.1 NADH dehydrogenase subunit 6 [Leptocorisa costalis]
MMIMLTLMMTISIMFMMLKHPLSMGITIIVQTMIISAIVGLMMGSFWFSYIIMITMLSGMLVLFIYMASVASNEKLVPSMKMTAMMIMMIMASIAYSNNMENNDKEMIMMMTTPENISLNNLFNMKHKFATMMLVAYLFFTMITVSFIVNISEGPLRVSKK